MPNTAPSQAKFISFKTLEQIYGISRQKAYALLKAGDIRALKTTSKPTANRSRVLIDVDSVEKYIDGLTPFRGYPAQK